MKLTFLLILLPGFLNLLRETAISTKCIFIMLKLPILVLANRCNEFSMYEVNIKT